MGIQIRKPSEELIEIGQKLFPKFDLSDPVRRSMYERAFYVLTGNDKMTQFNCAKGKGLLIIGDIGVGKSIMMKIFQIYFREYDRRFRWVNCLDFKDMLEDGITPTEIKNMYGKSLKCDLYIDDIGMGNADFNKYGNITNIVAEILLERNELYVSERFLTHLSSNIPTSVEKTAPPNVKSLERLYGDRVFDRIVQMCNLIVWTGKSLRK